jgi:predicted phage terminase large subunit-like protein
MPVKINGQLVELSQQIAEIDRLDYEESLYEFTKASWRINDSHPWIDGWCVEAVCEHLQAVIDGQIKNLIINQPPRTGKSSTCSVALAPWTWAQPTRTFTSGPGVTFLYASFNDRLSVRDSVKSRRIIASPWYQDLWGDRFKLLDDQNTRTRFGNDQGGERLITSIQAAGVTGDGGNCFVAGTKVAVPSGQRNIEEMKAGDEVLAFDLRQGKVVKSCVVATANRIANDLCTLYEVSGHRFTCTKDHPIHSPGRGFIRAGEMGPGDGLLISRGQKISDPHRPASDLRQLRQECGQTPTLHSMSQTSPLWTIGEVAAVTHHRGESVPVYDIQVEGQNNFFAESILAHNCIVIDDPNSAQEIESEAVIARTLDWWDGTMSTRLNDMNLGAFIVNQQRLGENDLTGHILSKEADDWCLLMLPMHYDPERSFFLPTGWKDPRTVPGELLWPERFSEQSIATLERKLGAWRAAGQLEQSPQPRGGGVIKRADWKLWQADTYPPMNFILGCVDTAFTLDTMNDPSGMIVWGAFNLDRTQHANRIYNRVTKKLMSIDRLSVDNLAHAMAIFGWTERYEFHQLIERVVQTARKFKVDLLLIENKASGISLGQELRRLYADEKFGVQFFDPKSQDKFARLVSVQHIFQEGHVCAPETEWAEAIITQVGQFPRAKHDEYVDLTSMGIRYLRDNGLLLRAPEVEAERDSHIVYPGGNGAGALYPC